MNMNKAIIGGLLWMGLIGVVAADDRWLKDFEQAKRVAAERNLPILADFAGSDWCGWCIRLDKEVFSKEDFIKYARESVVLFLADFPRHKELPEKQAKQNEDLAEHYGVQGLPTVLLLDSTGKVIAETGYEPGGAAAYVEHVKALLKAKKDVEKGK